jgi:NAD(P)H-dependent FMN reductase
MKLMIIFGSSRQGRRGEVVSNWVKDQATKDGRFEIDYVDLRELNLPFFDEPTSPLSMESLDEYTHPEGKAWAERVAKADGYILITPEYNYSTSAVLKNALDWVGKPWVGKAVGFVGYGSIGGGTRAVEHLRTIVVELSLFQAPPSVQVVGFKKAFDENGQPKEVRYNDNLKKVLNEVVRLNEGLSGLRSV